MTTDAIPAAVSLAVTSSSRSGVVFTATSSHFTSSIVQTSKLNKRPGQSKTLRPIWFSAYRSVPR